MKRFVVVRLLGTSGVFDNKKEKFAPFGDEETAEYTAKKFNEKRFKIRGYMWWEIKMTRGGAQ